MTPEEWRAIDIDNAWRSARALRRDLRKVGQWLDVLHGRKTFTEPQHVHGLSLLTAHIGGPLVLARIEIEFYLSKVEVETAHILRKIRRHES